MCWAGFVAQHVKPTAHTAVSVQTAAITFHIQLSANAPWEAADASPSGWPPASHPGHLHVVGIEDMNQWVQVLCHSRDESIFLNNNLKRLGHTLQLPKT